MGTVTEYVIFSWTYLADNEASLLRPWQESIWQTKSEKGRRLDRRNQKKADDTEKTGNEIEAEEEPMLQHNNKNDSNAVIFYFTNRAD